MIFLLRRFLPVLLCGLATLGRAELPPAVAATAKPCCTASAPPPVAPILPSGFLGWTNAYRLQNDRAEAVLVPAIGRLVHFAPPQGASPFRLESSLQGQVPAEGERFFNIGGDWFWPVSQARWASFSDDGKDWPPPAPLADRPWTCSAWTDADGAQCARFTRAYGPPLNLEASRLFRLASGSAALEVHQRIERTAPSDIPVVLWNISQIAQAEQIVLPVEKTSKFRGGLKALMGRKPGRRQLANCGEAATYRVSPGAETKLGSDSPRGWIAAVRGAEVILESVTNTAVGDYPDGGCVVEVYSNHGLGYSEIETLSPELLLAPGTVLENILRIELATTKSPLDACPLAAAVRALAGP
ncbi:MAG TPA: hypothetical protein DCM68_03410 [Verrucomicrobia bacterium]|nr:hypothetical protein [Verrucomicrobiota bacterium]